MRGDAKKHTSRGGFTLMEMLIVVAVVVILIAITIPIFSGLLEKSREAADLANVRSAYTNLMANAIDKGKSTPRITVNLQQKTDGWQRSLPITIGNVTYSGTDTDNWRGEPESGGVCILSYDERVGAIFTWKKASGSIADVKDTFDFGYDQLQKNVASINNNQAYFSKRKITIDGKSVVVRIYYAGSAAFKDAVASYTPTPSTYEESPFYGLEYEHTDESDGFAYYTYDNSGNVKEFTYVGPDKVYQTTDGGKTWRDITP